MAAADPRDLESGPFKCFDDLCSTNRRNRDGHKATLSVSVSSSGMPTSAINACSASRRSSSAASRVSPSPTAPTPSLSWADAHQTPSSSCSRVYGTCTVLTRALIATVSWSWCGLTRVNHLTQVKHGHSTVYLAAE